MHGSKVAAAGVLAVVMGAGGSAASAETGRLLMEYQSSTGKLPYDFGWEHEGNCLELDCPLNETPPECEWYGARDRDPLDGAADNDGAPYPTDTAADRQAVGGKLNDTKPPTGTNNNAPAPQFGGYDVVYAPGATGVSGSCTYTEWVEFDDNGANLEHLDTSFGAPRTPKGASSFPGAPAHQPLRLVGGDGNGIDGSLPASAENNRNRGKIKIKQNYDPAYKGPITMVVRAAFGPKKTSEAAYNFIEMDVDKSDGSGYSRFQFFHLWDNGAYVCDPTMQGSSPCGRWGADPGQEVIDALGVTPTLEWVTFRAACSADTNECQMWVGEGTQAMRAAMTPPGYVPGAGGGSSHTVRWGLISRADWTLWVDSVRVYEGIVPPAECPPLAYDVRTESGAVGSDSLVTQQDFNAFVECVTGPAPDPSLFDPASPNYVGLECFCMDANRDKAVDQTDFGVFQACLTGPTGGPADPGCDGEDL